jgi:hypothetical protein
LVIDLQYALTNAGSSMAFKAVVMSAVPRNV